MISFWLWVLVALGFGVLVVRQRSLAVGLVTVQALVLVGIALDKAATTNDVVAAAALGCRAIALAALFLWLLARTRESQPTRAGADPFARAAAGVALALAVTWLVPTVGLASRDAERAVIALVAFGLVTAALRRATLFQVLGIVLAETGLALAALQLPKAPVLLIELGVTLDLALIALVAAAFHNWIFAEFGTADSSVLRGLRDYRRELLAVAVVAVPALAALLVAAVPRRLVAPLALAFALPAGALALILSTLALRDDPSQGHGIAIDAAGGLLLGVTALVGLASVLVSPSYLGTTRGSPAARPRRERYYFALLYAFWAILLAVPLAGNLGVAWLLVEATTAVSALLVGFSGKARALEAGWKYLVLTSLGLGVALLGIVILAAGLPGGFSGLSWHSLPTYEGGSKPALVAYLLLLAGLAAKIGWAPVHNWLPDAHSEAPAPVSALLSAALLPSVLLVAWRSEHALAPVIGLHTAQNVLIGFGLVSLAVAVPFLWRSLAWKRLLAYSSLEHMGVIALGIGFATPLAIAGVAVHIAAHAIAKALGFYAATPLLGHEPRAAAHGVTGIGRTQRRLGAAMGLSLGTLAGLPPSPLFLSELLIVAGGFQAGRSWSAGLAIVLLGLAFVGLVHSLIETTAGKAHRRDSRPPPGLRSVGVLAAVSFVLLAALAGAAVWLPGTDLSEALVRGLP